jgi:ubiquinone/menaquinone biosynthesis C-methylase UbiE
MVALLPSTGRSMRPAVGSSMDEGEETQQTRQWSDALAAAWEKHRELLFESQRPVSEWLVDHLEPVPGHVVLELACGPGETGFLAAQRVEPGGRVICTDLGAGMVDAARRGAQARGLSNVECRTMDAQRVDVPSGSVDGVLCRFGLMLMPKPERALEGARRALRDGGRLAYAVWGPPDRNPWMTLMAMAVMQNGHQPAGNPFEPGGPFCLADPDRSRELVRDAGFGSVTVEELACKFRFDSFDEYWTVQSEVSGPLALLVSSLADEQVQAVRETLEPMLAPFRVGDGYELPSLAVAVAATAAS